ncbi:hypothetical protein CBS101457_002609 [Exobasidium rhododendri]|nr:hypothetical protein CBS101457_002609 [Exobasidium rhododendri]
MADKEDTNDAEAAMAAMGLPSNFAAPAFPRESGRGTRPPPPGPFNRGGRGRGRDGGWSDRGRGRGQGRGTFTSDQGDRTPSSVPNGPTAMMRGGFQQGNHNSRGSNKRKFGDGGRNFQSNGGEQAMLPLGEIGRWSFRLEEKQIPSI